MAKFKSLHIGTEVRVVSLADTDARCGMGASMERFVGGTFEVTDLDRQPSTGLGQVKLSNGWWFSPKGLEVLSNVGATEDTEPTGDEHGEFVTPETPVGTTVVYIGGDGGSCAPVGEPLELGRHDGDTRPLVKLIGVDDDYYYPDYKYLRVHVGGGVQEEPTEPAESTEPAPELTEADFKYTRVRAKDTGAEGVVLGRSKWDSIAVLHDVIADHYHHGNGRELDFVGVEDRTYYYHAADLEIIGGVQ